MEWRLTQGQRKEISGYPESMQASIRRIEETRLSRVQEEIPKLSLKERQELLQKFHPDYREGGRCELKVGINQGEKVPYELADLFEGESAVRPEEIDLIHVKKKWMYWSSVGVEAGLPQLSLQQSWEQGR